MMDYTTRLEQAVDYLVIWLQIRAPKKSGNLSMNAIKKVWNPTLGTWDIVIGGELAPYAPFTNEVWVNRPGVNPNQGWIQTACIEAKPTLQAILTGVIHESEVSKLMVDRSQALGDQFANLAASI